MSKIRLYGATSGYVELAAPDVSDDATLTLPTGAAGFVPGNGGIGTNVVTYQSGAAFSTSSTSFTPVTSFSVTITPTSASSKVLLLLDATYSNSTTAITTLTIDRGGTNLGSGVDNYNGLKSTRTDETFESQDCAVILLDSPATTSAVTYTLQIKTNGGIGRLNERGDGSGLGSSRLTAIEVAA